MLERFDLRPLLTGVDRGLRERRQFGQEPVDVAVSRVLFWVPLTVGILSALLQLTITAPGQLTAAFGLMSSALLSAFTLIARWRETLSTRQQRIDGVPKRALDEAVALILFSSVLGVFAAAVTGVMGTFEIPADKTAPMHWVGVGLSAIVLFLGARLVLQFVIVVHLLWEQYEAVNPPSVPQDPPGRENRRKGAQTRMAVDAQRQNHRRLRPVAPVSVAVIVCALVAIVLGVVGVLERGTTALVLIPGVLALVVGTTTLFRPER